MSNHFPRLLPALLMAFMPTVLVAQQNPLTPGAEGSAAEPALQSMPQPPDLTPAAGAYRPTAPEAAELPPLAPAYGYDPMTDPGHGWAAEEDSLRGAQGYGAYPAAPAYGGEPDYGYDAGYYGYPPADSMRYPGMPAQGGYRQDMGRGGYPDPYAQSAARAPHVDYHYEMVKRLDAVIDRLERIERTLQSQGR